jgi:hypothetical protein
LPSKREEVSPRQLRPALARLEFARRDRAGREELADDGAPHRISHAGEGCIAQSASFRRRHGVDVLEQLTAETPVALALADLALSACLAQKNLRGIVYFA